MRHDCGTGAAIKRIFIDKKPNGPEFESQPFYPSGSFKPVNFIPVFRL